MNMNMNMN